jgi:Holliday junction resolvasome RuvABC endonuclease subunit
MGLDVSTTTIGISVVKRNKGQDDNIEIIMLEGLVLKNRELNKYKGAESLFLKNSAFKVKLIEIQKIIEETYHKPIDRVFIEEPLFGSNNIMTVGVLMKFNGIISSTIYDNLHIVPDYISSYDARCFAFPELMEIRVFNKKNERRILKDIEKDIKKGKLVLFGGYPFQIDKKTIIQELIAEKFPYVEWIYDKKGNLIKSSFDSTDALACILGYLNKEKQNDQKPFIENYTINDDLILYNTKLPNSTEVLKHSIRFSVS